MKRLNLSGTKIGLGAALIWFFGVLAYSETLVGGDVASGGLASGHLSQEAARMLAIFGAAVALWISEAIPLAATAVGIILAEILLVSDQAVLALAPQFEPNTYQSFYASLAHPVLMLFLGGFVLADSAAKYQLDRNLAGVMLRPFGSSPRSLLGGLMVITALLSMFMSNTATTAAMIAVIIPVTASLDPSDRLRVSLTLAVPVAANVGGLGTPVGTPPNAIALGRLADEGIRVDFLTWMVAAVPLMVVVLVFAWLVLTWRYPATTKAVDLTIGGAFDRSRPAIILYATFFLTIIAWLSEPIHGVPASIVGFVPVVVLLSSGVFTVDDLRKLNWHVLWLVGGGIALGSGVASTGLDAWMVGLLDWESMPNIVLLAALGLLAIVLSTVISNSATANLLIPIGITLATSGATDLDPLLAGLLIAIACSLAMALPVSTPPNAVAYATGTVATKDLASVGVLVGGFGLLLAVFVAPVLWKGMGLM